MMTIKHLLTVLTLAMVVGCGPKQPDPAPASSDPPSNSATDPTSTDPTSTDPTSTDPTSNAPTADPPADPEAAPAAVSDDAAEGPGVAVGETVSIQLKDQSGNHRTLEDLAAEGELVAIVFYRSADW